MMYMESLTKSFNIPNAEISRIKHAQKIYTPLKMHSTHLLLVFVATPTAFTPVLRSKKCTKKLLLFNEVTCRKASVAAVHGYGSSGNGGDDADGRVAAAPLATAT